MAMTSGGDEIVADMFGPSSLETGGSTAQSGEPSSPIMTAMQVHKHKPEPMRRSHSHSIQPLDPFESSSPASDSDLGRIFSLSPLPTIVLNADLRVAQVSESHLAFSGYTRAEIVGHSIYDLPAHKVPATDTTSLHRSLTHAIKTGELQIMDDIAIDNGSDYTVYSVHVAPIQDQDSLLYVVLSVHGVTKESSARHFPRELAYMNETYKVLVDTLKDYAIFMLDITGCVATWNSAAAMIKGYSSDEIIGRHFSTFYGDDDRIVDKPGRELQVCLKEGKLEDEGWRYRKDGSRFWANVMITPIYTSGCHVGFVKVTRDLTERKAAEGRLIAAFEESSQLKLDFLANMSHEIRTPMHGMLMSIEMLSGTSLDEQQKEYMKIIDDTGSVLLQTINNILDYSKLSSGTFNITPGVVDVKEVVEAVSRNCRSSLKPGVDLHVNYSDRLPKYLKGDPHRYRQIIQNLIGNAVKFTDGGSVEVSVQVIEDPQDSSAFEITTVVVDTGIGVPEDAVGSLFIPLTRFADSSRCRFDLPVGLLGLRGLTSLELLLTIAIRIYAPNFVHVTSRSNSPYALKPQAQTPCISHP